MTRTEPGAGTAGTEAGSIGAPGTGAAGTGAAGAAETGAQAAARAAGAAEGTASVPTDGTAGGELIDSALSSGPWSVRSARHHKGRAALEVYEHDELLDVVVSSTLSTAILCGARRRASGDRPAGFAWGRLPSDGSLPLVEFSGGLLNRLHQPASVVPMAGEFWLAWAEGPFNRVLVRHGDQAPVRLRPGRAG